MTDDIGGWTIKKVPPEARREIIEAARRADQHIGDWLVETARARIAAERAPAGEVIPPGRPEPAGSDPRASLDVVERLVPLMAQIAAAPNGRALMAQMRRVLGQHLRALEAGQTGGMPRLTGPDDRG